MQEEFPYRIDWALPKEWPEAMQMIWKTYLKFEAGDYTEEGIRNFFEFVTDDGLYQSFLRGSYKLLLAHDGDRIVGAASMRNCNYLSLLFVDEEYHRRGIGRRLMDCLCDYLKRTTDATEIVLRAAPYAIGFYERIGFTKIREEEQIAGIRVTPMKKPLF